MSTQRRVGALTAAALVFALIGACLCPMPASAEVAEHCCTIEDGWSDLPTGCCVSACEDPGLVAAEAISAASALENPTMRWGVTPALSAVDPHQHLAPDTGITTHTILRS